MRKSRTSIKQAGLALASVPPEQLLGGLTPEVFLRDYWQKRPLLVRQALPGFGEQLGPEGLKQLACRDDAESRLVRHARGRWHLDHGPFTTDELEDLPRRNWSLLVSGVNLLLPFGDSLLRAFGFLPQARLDDLMVSYAPEGGGVGPHFDSYDVFLLQGLGRRRWEISAQTDLELVDDAPLRILKRFEPEQSWELEAGDLLYLPPKYAHNGVALGPCMTWSIGFRAPKTSEICAAFLNYVQDRLDELPGMYADPDLILPDHPAEITPMMLERLAAMIGAIKWTPGDVETFLGTYLSEPKPQIFFDPPKRPLTLERFVAQATEHGLALDARSRLLFVRHIGFFMNGELVRAPRGGDKYLTELADQRRLSARKLPQALQPVLYEWYRAGYVRPSPDA
jgi:50S ribosomal protein L16 3-hydroxylase